MMRNLATAVSLSVMSTLVPSVAGAQPAEQPAAEPLQTECIQRGSIVSTDAIDNHTILFKMRDGTVWRNTLTGTCPGLTTGGWAWSLSETDSVCHSYPTIQALYTGATCQLGSFTQDRPPRAAAR